MNVLPINCNAGHRYFNRVEVPVGLDMVAPTVAGTVTGIRVSFSATRHGTPIDAALTDMPATEVPGEPDAFYVDVSQTLHQTYLLPLGRGKLFYAQWEKPGVTKNDIDTFVVATGTDI